MHTSSKHAITLPYAFLVLPMKMTQKIRILITALCLALYFPGCSFTSLPAESEQPAIFDTAAESTAFTTMATAEPFAEVMDTQPPTTEPVQTETPLPQIITQPEPDDDDFVLVTNYIPDIVIDLRYATDCNFTNQQIYGFTDVWLRYGTVKKLMSVQQELKPYGYGLKIWDGFRPLSAQFQLWEICPDPTYVSDPTKGSNSHSRGNTVDITLVDADGTELIMPTGFDDFSALADRDYSDCSREAADNSLFLESLMIQHGFKPYSGEWWHFTDSQTYPVDEAFAPVSPSLYYADCKEYISLRREASTAAEVITKIPAGGQFLVVARSGGFALVEYQDLVGYVLADYTQAQG